MRNTSRANMRQFALSIVGLVVVLAVLACVLALAVIMNLLLLARRK